MTWHLPLYVMAVVAATLWFNLVDVKYRLKSKTANIRWCFVSTFESKDMHYYVDGW